MDCTLSMTVYYDENLHHLKREHKFNKTLPKKKRKRLRLKKDEENKRKKEKKKNNAIKI